MSPLSNVWTHNLCLCVQHFRCKIMLSTTLLAFIKKCFWDRTSQSSGALWKTRWTSWAPVPNSPCSLCGRKETVKKGDQTGHELYESPGGRPGLPVPSRPYGLCVRKAKIKGTELSGSRGGRPGLPSRTVSGRKTTLKRKNCSAGFVESWSSLVVPVTRSLGVHACLLNMMRTYC